MHFIDSYKRLEKLCGDLLNSERPISAYIDEMESKPRGAFRVPSWSDDLKKLKHYRWVRNKISHEPGYTEENMCSADDALWLDQFYARIINQTDPLALYHKATIPRAPASTAPRTSTDTASRTSTDTAPYAQNRADSRHAGCLLYLLAAILVALNIAAIAFLVWQLVH